MEEEIWKSIPGYDYYEVSSKGRVRSIGRWENMYNGGVRFRKGRILKPCNRGRGYMCVGIWNEKGHKLENIHRLVAEVFIPNPDRLPCVNHKDENPSNNSVNNLEWCSSEYNNNYGTHTKKIMDRMIQKGDWNPKYCRSLTGLSVKEANHLRYIDNKNSIKNDTRRKS